MKYYDIKIRNNLLLHSFIYSIHDNPCKKHEISFSFWGKAMDFTGEQGNQLPFFVNNFVIYAPSTFIEIEGNLQTHIIPNFILWTLTQL